ncbi:hypothetical protein, partial [Alishewanella longhuensis]
MQQPHIAAVYRLFAEPDPHNAQYWQLVYEEALLNTVPLVFASQELPFTFRRVLLTGQADIQFSYYAWPNADAKFAVMGGSEEFTAEKSWFEQYDSMQTQIH